MKNMLELFCLIIKEIFLLSTSLCNGIELSAIEMYGSPPKNLRRKKGRVIAHR